MKNIMTQEQVLRYLDLVDRRLFIVMHSGVDWKPEYEKELADIDKEISYFRKIINSAYETAMEDDTEKAVEDTRKEITLEMCQAAEKAQNYDYQSLYDRWPTMSPVDVIAECKEVLSIYDTLQQTPEPLGLDSLNIDGFMQSMLFLESFCMRYLVDIFFNA